MQLHNHTETVVRACGLAIPPGRTGTVNDADWHAWRAQHPEIAGILITTPDSSPDVVRRRELAAYILRGAPLAMTRDGLPRCDALSRALGRTVSGVERDRVWAQVEANYCAMRA